MNIDPKLTETLKDMLRLQGRQGDNMSLYALGLIEHLESQQPASAMQSTISGTESVVYARSRGRLSYFSIFSDSHISGRVYPNLAAKRQYAILRDAGLDVVIIDILHLDRLLGE